MAHVRYTLFRATAVTAGSSVGCIFSVPGGSAMSCPIKLFGFILGEHTDGVLFEAALKLIYDCLKKQYNEECAERASKKLYQTIPSFQSDHIFVHKYIYGSLLDS